MAKYIKSILLSYLTRFSRIANQYVAVRKAKKILISSACLVCILLVYVKLQSRTPFSAIGCKSKIAQIVIPKEQKRVDYLSPMGVNYRELEGDFFYFLTTLTHNCQDQVHIGPPDDGGWDVCVERRFMIAEPCLVYSFGVGNDFRFEKGIEKLLKCEVHAFDPSMEVASHQYSANGFFHNYGVDSMDTYAARGKWKLRRMATIMKELGHADRTLDLVKMDIEFSEWPTLYDLVTTGLIKSIRQLVLEVHTPEVDTHARPDHVCSWTTPETLQFMMRTMIELKNAGFQVFHSRTNHRTRYTSTITSIERFCCYDVHLVNINHPKNRAQW